jgi:hypothetical protein
MTARFNDSADGSANFHGEATQRHCAVVQTMARARRKIQNLGMISLIRAISTNIREKPGVHTHNGGLTTDGRPL